MLGYGGNGLKEEGFDRGLMAVWGGEEKVGCGRLQGIQSTESGGVTAGRLAAGRVRQGIIRLGWLGREAYGLLVVGLGEGKGYGWQRGGLGGWLAGRAGRGGLGVRLEELSGEESAGRDQRLAGGRSGRKAAAEGRCGGLGKGWGVFRLQRLQGRGWLRPSTEGKGVWLVEVKGLGAENSEGRERVMP